MANRALNSFVSGEWGERGGRGGGGAGLARKSILAVLNLSAIRQLNPFMIAVVQRALIGCDAYKSLLRSG
jgi:hypothetical protein